MKWMRVVGYWWFAWMALFAAQVHAQESLCAVVKIEIAQELTLERQAFEANMRITNSLDSMALEQVKIDILFEDSDGNPVLASSDPNNDSASFFISLDDYAGINSVETGDNGSLVDGKIDPADVADLRWLIVPTAGAGGDDGAGRLYYVGAKLSFTFGGETQTMEVAPDTIVVKPQPNLTLDYFLPSEVNGDNPFTPEIEPVEPYNLGVRLSNKGSGPARAVKIQSAQPKIVENELGLLVDFRITGSFINDSPANKTLLLNFGDIAAKSNATGRWIMETSLTGRFTEFAATFSHVDEYGGALTSLIEAVNTHFLLRDVIVDLPGRDSVRDFLAQDGSITRVYESQRTGVNLADCTDCLAVTSLTGALSGPVASGSGVNRTLTASATAGPVHIKLPDPYEGDELLTGVVRADGKVLNPANYWLSKSIKDDKIHYDYFVNVFDTQGGASYTLTFGGTPSVNRPPVIQHIASYTTYETGQVGFLVQASDPDKTTPVLMASNLPAGASFEDKGNGQGVFSWFPQIGQAGSYTLEFAATDGELNAVRATTVIVFPNDDRDGDGMPDVWELEHFGDLSRDGTGDYDGDGISDLDEYLRDSDPTVAEVAPARPQLYSPAYGAEVTTLAPKLQIINGDHGNIGSVDYTFEVYENESMTRQLARIEGVAEGVDTTELVLDSSALSGSTLKDNTHYFWRVNARTAAGASEWVNGRFFVNTVNDAPSAFSLSKPSDQTLVDTLTPTLITNNSADIDGDTLTYSFQVFAEDDIDFSNPVAEVTGLAQGNQGQTAWTVSTPLVNGQLYFWIAIATDEHGAETIADPASFIVSTSNLAPHAPAVSSPSEGEVVMGSSATLVVNNAFDPERQSLEYWFELDEVNTFDSPAKQTSGAIGEGSTTTSWTVEGLVEGRTYYWRAKADDGSAQSPWVASAFRMYTDAQPPEVPTLDNPAPDAWVEVLAPTLSVHMAMDPNGDEVSYQFELYSDELQENLVASTTTSELSWDRTSPLQNHQYYYWRARAVDTGGLASGWSDLQRFFINEDGIDDAPTMRFVLPDQAIDTYGGNIKIQWVDNDPDSNALINLYYNESNLIAADIPEDPDGEGDVYIWNIDELPPGTYQLSAVIRDASTEVHAQACCVIRKSEREVAARVTALTDPVTDESGLMVAEFEVVLDGAPRAGSTVLMNLSVSDASEGEILADRTYLEFTPDNWSVPQIVRVRGKDDCSVDGDQRYHLQFSPAISTDPTFDGTVTPAVPLTNLDNEIAGASLSVCGFQLQSVQVIGDRTHFVYSARLNNHGLGIGGAKAAASTAAGNLSLVSGLPLSFPAVAEGQSAWSSGTFVVSSAGTQEPNLGALTWSIEAKRPTVESVAPSEGEEGKLYSYQVRASGGPDDVFTFTLVDAPDGMVIDPVSGLIEWTPATGQHGPRTVVVEVRDQSGGIARQTFIVDVAEDTSTPRIITVDTNPAGDADYRSLSDALSGLSGTFARPVVIHARATSGQDDTVAVSISGFEPTSEKPLTIVLEEGYKLAVEASSSQGWAMILRAPHVTLRGEGGSIRFRNNGIDNTSAIAIQEQPEGSVVILDGLRLQGELTGDPVNSVGIAAGDPKAIHVLRNNQVVGFNGRNASAGLFVGGTAYVYNNTLVESTVGIRLESLNARVFNNLATGNGQDYSGAADVWTMTGHNVSSDASSPDEHYRNREVAFIDDANGQYALAPWDEDAAGQGMDLSSADFYPFADDIRRQVRTSPWDVGAHTVGEVSNWPPFINSSAIVTAEEDTDYQYAVEASDNDGDALTYRLAKAPSGMAINSTSGLITWRPSSEQVGDFTVQVEVTDGRGGIAQQQFVLVVSPANSGGARLVVVDTDPQSKADYRSLAEAVSAETGELSQPLLIRARATTGLKETAPVVIEGIGTSDENPLTVVLEDGFELNVSALSDSVHAISIRNNHVRIRGEGGRILVHNNGYEDVAGVVVDGQSDGSTIMLDNLRVSGAITGEPAKATGILARDPNAIYVLRNNLVSGFTGSYTNHGLYVAGAAFIYNNTLVANRYGLRVEAGNAVAYNNLAVGNVEDFVSWQNQWSVTGHNVSSDGSSPDADYRNRIVSFADPAAGNYALAPWDDAARGKALDLSGTEFFPFNVDAALKVRTNPWDIGALSVGEVNNWPPFISSEPVVEAMEEEPYRYEVLATDQDGDTLTYTLVSAPEGMTIQSDSGVIEWVPSVGQQGEAHVVVSVGDGFGGVAQQEFSITVAAAPEPEEPDEPTSIWEQIQKALQDLLDRLLSGRWFNW
ncbi:putative Ig domain-containing protein [Marinobacter alkaliphilus]|uniref:Ig domain-containing protein n=1 Tax=Marinobacter alkaliphilus TaxID=254719 RepID=A0ABZ3E0X8_9GAMM